MQVFRAECQTSHVARLNVLKVLEQERDPRVIAFMLSTVVDTQEPLEIRSHIVKWLRTTSVSSVPRASVANALLQILTGRAEPALRVESAVALAEYTDVPGVSAIFGCLTLDTDEPLDLRYCAFTALERIGPTPECVGLIRRLVSDDELGPASRSLLLTWHLD
jgi:hypothetical protein